RGDSGRDGAKKRGRLVRAVMWYVASGVSPDVEGGVPPPGKKPRGSRAPRKTPTTLCRIHACSRQAGSPALRQARRLAPRGSSEFQLSGSEFQVSAGRLETLNPELGTRNSEQS